MCRLFNEENNMETGVYDVENNLVENKNHQRSKREVESSFNKNPLLNNDDVVRIEGIVDKLYDDLIENGTKVTYRRREIAAVTTETNTNGNRRFNFAPAIMTGAQGLSPAPLNPLEDDGDLTQPETNRVGVRWIKRWKHGIIPYFIDPKTYDSYLASEIIKAFDYIEKATCIRLQRLREKPLDEKSFQQVEWLYISNPSGIKQCVHSNERKANRGVQMVVFGYSCLSLGEIAHEIMHVLGFSHEHTRPDRDRYVTIRWDNIKDGYKKYFSLHPKDVLSHLPYDYASVLHYPSRAFSRNGQITISVPVQMKIGQRTGFSEIDIEKIGIIFGTECMERNKDYLLMTCTRVVQNKPRNVTVSPDEIRQYFQDRTWQYGIINYKIRDKMEFSAEERENIKAVINHIEKETCIEFRDINEPDDINEGENNELEKAKESNEKNIEQKNDTINEIEKDEYKNETSLRRNLIAKHKGLMKVDKKKDKKDIVKERTRGATPQAKRRHAPQILILTRSKHPGCKCPPPGRPNENQVLEINEDCFNSVNDLLHFFVHTLGLEHQHNMYDRDSYLEIVWDELTPEQKREFEQKLPPAASVGFPYDYQSVMHFPWLQIKDGVTNIMYPVWNDGWAMGHWQGLSATDVLKLNRIYSEECANRKQQSNK